jgi:hypothetical protein
MPFDDLARQELVHTWHLAVSGFRELADSLGAELTMLCWPRLCTY